MGGLFISELEQVKRSCIDFVSQMRCPHHFKNAAVEMDGEGFDDFSVDVITCCEEFKKCVEEALDKLLAQRGMIIIPVVPITTPNPSIKYSRANPSATTPASNIRIRQF
jgi:hypothetical protein